MKASSAFHFSSSSSERERERESARENARESVRERESERERERERERALLKRQRLCLPSLPVHISSLFRGCGAILSV